MERTCPQCQAPVPVLSGFPDWCDECDWNLKPLPALEQPGGRFTQLARALGRRSGEQMARELLAARELEPRWTPARIAAYAVAIGFHVLTLALIVGGLAAIVAEFPNLVSILIGAAMLGAGLVIRPRTQKLDPEDGSALDPARTPTLHAVVADIASRLDRPPPDEILISTDWNAYWAVVGLRRRRVLILGLPLLAALEPRERVALIAHELGHDRNGDARQGLVVGSAVIGLNRLSALLLPAPGIEVIGLEREGLGPAEWITRGLLWLVARPVDAILWLEARLLLRDMQRAEYLADALAARVAGSQAAVALHERLLLWSTFSLVVQHAAHDQATDIFDRLREALEAVPDRERERRRRAARLEETRLLDTHPPTGLRIDLIEGRAAAEPQFVLDEARSRAIDAELAPLAEPISREILDRYRGRLYYG